MRYVKAKRIERFEAKTYRIYVTDSLKALINNPDNPRYIEMIDLTPPDTRTAEDVIESIRDKLR